MHYENVHTAVIDDAALPWMPFLPYTDKVFLKPFKLDPVRGEMIVLLKAPSGFELPKHHHSGTVIVYTVEGRWKYKEHDWIATPGSVVFETAGSSHTPQAVAGHGQVITFNIVVGDLIFMDANDNILAIENWKSMMQRYLAHCEAKGLTPVDLTSFAG
jgi:quercetin dioxygenase-like cupin family protein